MPDAREQAEAAGLVICPITVPGELWEPRFPKASSVAEAASAVRVATARPTETPLRPASLDVAPGLVRVRQQQGPPAVRTRSGKRRPITGWSRKSRARMTARLATLDYTGMGFDPTCPPALVTLTYPGAWEVVAPDAASVKRHLVKFQRSFHRSFGSPLVGVWKLEFQRRGAPHFHIFCTPPASVSGEVFRSWLSSSWASIVAHPDPDERERHRRAGTGLDFAIGLRSDDPRRVATYFAKHQSAGFGPKEYQHTAPQLWLDAGSVGRFWGYWGLHPLEVSVPLTPADALLVARVLRRWARANTPARRVAVFRTDTATGQVRRRYARRRVRRMSGKAGFLLVPDGPALAAQLAGLFAPSASSGSISSRYDGDRSPDASGGAAVRRPVRSRLQ